MLPLILRVEDDFYELGSRLTIPQCLSDVSSKPVNNITRNRNRKNPRPMRMQPQPHEHRPSLQRKPMARSVMVFDDGVTVY